MQRICTSLAENGYSVTLVGRTLPNSIPLEQKEYQQKRLTCWFNNGKLFYFEYNFRLILFFLFKKIDAICAIDLDTIIPCYYISRWKRIARIYDAHELFTEQKEIVTRPAVYSWWKKIETRYLPKFKHGYTVCESIADIFKAEYGVSYKVIRNIPLLVSTEIATTNTGEKFILYQGAVNEARGLEGLIPAMKNIDYKLIICGNGNFMPQLKKLISENNVQHKVELKGMIEPNQLKLISQQAFIGLNLVENVGLNQYYSLANKFFDYIHAEIPQVTMQFPEYAKLNEPSNVAVLIGDTSENNISTAINKLASDFVMYNKIKQNCATIKKNLNWQAEEKVLLAFYQSILKN